MPGAVILVVLLVAVFPVMIMLTGAAIAGVFGFLLGHDADRRGRDTVWKDLGS